jgi:threonyl-tRNA synthetase
MSINSQLANLELDTKRHSFAHLLAAAVKQMFPETQFGVGPVIDNGCYYDFVLPRTLIPEDLELLENHIKELLARNLVFKRQEIELSEAILYFDNLKQPLKVELLENLRDNGTTSMSEEEKADFQSGEKPLITIYRIVDEKTGEVIFEDLCKGPHVESIKELSKLGYKLDKFSAAYWRGDQERGINMQRLYALVFETATELDGFVEQREEAKRRDHRILGEQLDIFAFSELIGKGLPLWLPKGRVLIDLLEKWAAQEEKKQGYKPVATPLITKENLFLTSGHLPMYRDSMYSPMDIDGENFYIKPMNCPFHHQIFAARKRSYKELPLRFSEYGFCHRYEDSGSLFGLMRTRAMKMNDAHIYCTVDQAVEEFVKSVDLIKLYFKELNITDYWLELALRDPTNDKYHKDEAMWIKAEALSKEACDRAGVDYVIVNDGAAFYGPKIDIQMKSVIGKVYTCSTSQIDLYTPTKFDLTYTDEKQNEVTPVVIHRAPLSTEVRMIGFLIEHYAGKFPFWLAPEQIKILTINDQVLPYVDKVKEILDSVVLMKPLKYNELRYSLDDRSESLGKKIREAKTDKIPVLMIIGQKDVEANQVSLEYKGESVKIGLDELKAWFEKV